MTRFDDQQVKAKFSSYPRPQRARLMALRELVFQTAAATPGVGRIEETLKWGQPSYGTPDTRSGTPLRLDVHPAGGVALYVNCQTDLVEQFRAHYPLLDYEGVRAVVIPAGEPVPEQELGHIIALALTYHARGKRRLRT